MLNLGNTLLNCIFLDACISVPPPDLSSVKDAMISFADKSGNPVLPDPLGTSIK